MFKSKWKSLKILWHFLSQLMLTGGRLVSNTVGCTDRWKEWVHGSLFPPFELFLLPRSKWKVTKHQHRVRPELPSGLRGWRGVGPAGCGGRRPSWQHPSLRIRKEVLLKFRWGKGVQSQKYQRHANSSIDKIPLGTYQISRELTASPRIRTVHTPWSVNIQPIHLESYSSLGIQSLKMFKPFDPIILLL